MMARFDRITWQKQVIQNVEFPAGARLVAHTIALYTDPAGRQGVWLSLTDLCNMTGLSVPTIRTYLLLLTRAGYLRNEQGARFLAFPGELPWPSGAAAAAETPR